MYDTLKKLLNMLRKFLLAFTLFIPAFIKSQESNTGNLAFPASQQPSPLVSFGQNILAKAQIQVQGQVSQLCGNHQDFVSFAPNILYGLTDRLSLFLVMPVAVDFAQHHHHSAGLEDAIVQLEHAFYTQGHSTFYDQATLILNITLPLGSAKKKPPTGIGANSFFIGGTFSRMETNWFYFISSGGIINSSSHKTKFGDQFFYQLGCGRRIASTHEWLLDWMVELSGTHSWKDKINGRLVRESGGHVLHLTPSLFLSSRQHYFLQFGIGFPVYQSLCGHQDKNHYFLVINQGWTF